MIDLGIGPVGATLPTTTLHIDELDLLVHLLDVDVLPVVLDTGPRFDSPAARDAVFADARTGLTAAGLVDGAAVHPDLARQVRTLARPRCEIALRRHGTGPVYRACLARDDDGDVLVSRSDDTVTLRALGDDPAGSLAHLLDASAPLPFSGINCPTSDLAAALDRATDPRRAVDALTAVGVRGADAAVVGPALADRPTVTEIVGLTHGHGDVPQIHGPVTVFDTAFGRIVGSTSLAADGVRWTSLTPGAPGRLRRVLLDLLDAAG
ncbi:ESX secretion-associated protein EspG [Prescottella subtropica]|uniref:ESX secretion-associated protein EspG n=1 Tax=Prescottella subtropica TaxID=2545757 RepID=UPI0010F51A6B|nr:ESX secretion-associated protein EspG [Prescottella subtropica]